MKKIQFQKVNTEALKRFCSDFQRAEEGYTEREKSVCGRLFPHQRFLFNFAKKQKDVDGIQNYILYYLPGSGKTIAALAYLEAIENSFGNNFSNYFIFSKRQIIANTWKEDKNSFFAEKISHKLSYFAFDDVVQLRQAIFAIQQISTNPESKRALIIFDEFHHLMKTVINNEVSDLAVSDKVKKRNLNQLKSNLYFIMLSSANLNFLLMSGTPIYQEAFELCLQ
jgi:hypothetical protein